VRTTGRNHVPADFGRPLGVCMKGGLPLSTRYSIAHVPDMSAHACLEWAVMFVHWTGSLSPEDNGAPSANKSAAEYIAIVLLVARLRYAVDHLSPSFVSPRDMCQRLHSLGGDSSSEEMAGQIVTQ
jgi:hypothetical protein